MDVRRAVAKHLAPPDQMGARAKQFALDHDGLNLIVEFDQGTLFWYRARLIVNGDAVDERSVFVGTTRLRTQHPRSLVVDATAGILGPKRVVLHDGSRTIPFAKHR